MEIVSAHTQSTQNQGTSNPSNPQHRIYNPVFCFACLFLTMSHVSKVSILDTGGLFHFPTNFKKQIKNISKK